MAITAIGRMTSTLDRVALNPQPLPPGPDGSKLSKYLDDFCGTRPPGPHWPGSPLGPGNAPFLSNALKKMFL